MPDGTPERAPRRPLPAPGSALVLTAGLGTRLRPLSYTRAKPAVPVAGQSLVRRVVRWLAAWNITDLVLNLSYRPETITTELGDGSDLGVRVRYSWEVPILGSGGGPRRALPLIDTDPFFIVNGDTLTDLDLRGMWNAHEETGALVTLAITADRRPERYGGVVTETSGAVVGFVPSGSVQQSSHFIGVQLVNRSVFSEVPPGASLDSIRDVYIPLLRARPGSVRAYRSEARFWDVGTPEDYLETVLAIARAEGLQSLPTGRDSRVAASARLIDTVVWDRVQVEAGAELVRCVVGDGARVPAGSRFDNCAIVPASGLAPTSSERVVGDLLVAEMTSHGLPGR
jgi:mannose-1-phosphate guanylyltransferase